MHSVLDVSKPTTSLFMTRLKQLSYRKEYRLYFNKKSGFQKFGNFYHNPLANFLFMDNITLNNLNSKSDQKGIQDKHLIVKPISIYKKSRVKISDLIKLVRNTGSTEVKSTLTNPLFRLSNNVIIPKKITSFKNKSKDSLKVISKSPETNNNKKIFLKNNSLLKKLSNEHNKLFFRKIRLNLPSILSKIWIKSISNVDKQRDNFSLFRNIIDFNKFDMNFIKRESLYTKLKYSRSPAYDIVSGGAAAFLAAFIGFLVSEKFGIELVDSGDFYIAFMFAVFAGLALKPFMRILSAPRKLIIVVNKSFKSIFFKPFYIFNPQSLITLINKTLFFYLTPPVSYMVVYINLVLPLLIAYFMIVLSFVYL
jgi:hypothetical protein